MAFKCGSVLAICDLYPPEYEVSAMVILTIHYLDKSGNPKAYDSLPMEVNAAMDRVMRFVASGVDVINHLDTGSMDVLLLHRATGITIGPATT